MNDKPWDARLAAKLITPLIDTPVHPNILTLIRLAVGIAGAIAFAIGTNANCAAILIVLSNFLDHTDGELARLSGKTSDFGHRLDLASDAIVTVGMFIGIGYGLNSDRTLESLLADFFPIENIALIAGIIAGIAVAGIFHLRNVIESHHGKVATKQPHFLGFEAEDILYLLPLVTIYQILPEFLMAAVIGAPLALLGVAIQYRIVMRPS